MGSSHRFFKQYNRIILATFSFVALASSALFYMQLRSHYDHEVSTITTKFIERSASLDASIKGAVDHVNALQVQAQDYFITHPDPQPPSPLLRQIQTLPDKAYYTLDTLQPPFTSKSAAAVTGEGKIDQISSSQQQELEMALSLNPIFQASQTNVPNLAWVYYTSKQRFIAIYPWVASKDFSFQPALYDHDFYLLGLPQNNPQRRQFWTKAYTDEGGKGLMVTAAAPVYRQDEFLGTVALDFTLDELNQFFKTFHPQTFHPQTNFFLINQHNQLLAHPTLVSSKDKDIKLAGAALPKDLSLEQIAKLPTQQMSRVGNYLVFRYEPKNAPWQVFLWIPHQEMLLESFLGSNWLFLLLLPGLAMVLAIANYLTRKEFIAPAQKLVEHIAHESQGLSPIPSNVPANWQPWFQKVSQSFSENHHLLQQLAARTQALEAKNQTLQETKMLLAETNRTLEIQVDERTCELKDTLTSLKQAQAQLVQTEKMSGLGRMVAGIAHEINNPVSFIHGNLDHVDRYTHNLMQLIALYQQQDVPPPAVLAKMKAIDFEFLQDDLIKVIQSMKVGTERIRDIVLSLRNFSRLDESGTKTVDIHTGLDSTLLILQSQIKAFDIQVIKNYGELPLVECYAGHLNQVFMNIIGNAVDALEETEEAVITICTESCEDAVMIHIIDNGPGISAENQERLFDPFFTTKPVGQGTGLGLSISYQIVMEKHGGKLWCKSSLGVGTEFIIEIPIEILASSLPCAS